MCPYDRPFLGPLYAWNAAYSRSTGVKLPAMISLLLHFLVERLKNRGAAPVVQPNERRIEVFRADAKAEKDLIVMGGWDSSNGQSPAEAAWYSTELSKETAPWAYRRGDPFRVIASLELLAALLSLIWLVPPRAGTTEATARLVGLTDNQGNSYLLAKMMTSRFPLCVVLMELAVQMELRGVYLHGEWTPRDQNTEADALTMASSTTSTRRKGSMQT